MMQKYQIFYQLNILWSGKINEILIFQIRYLTGDMLALASA